MNEFKTAIKGERLVELNLKNVLGKMGVQLNNQAGQYERFKATEQRRRLMKKEYEARLAEKTKEMRKIEKLEQDKSTWTDNGLSSLEGTYKITKKLKAKNITHIRVFLNVDTSVKQ